MACLWKQRSLDYFCLTTTGKLDFYFAAMAVFLGENLFNEKELQGRDRWLGAQKWAARCSVFDGLSDFHLSF